MRPPSVRVIVAVLEVLLMDEGLDQREDEVADKGRDSDLEAAFLADERLRLGKQVDDRRGDQDA